MGMLVRDQLLQIVGTIYFLLSHVGGDLFHRWHYEGQSAVHMTTLKGCYLTSLSPRPKWPLKPRALLRGGWEWHWVGSLGGGGQSAALNSIAGLFNRKRWGEGSSGRSSGRSGLRGGHIAREGVLYCCSAETEEWMLWSRDKDATMLV